MKKQYGIYMVKEEYAEDGRYLGFRCGVVESTKKQGKLYVRTDGRENYQSPVISPPVEPKDDELEI